MAGLVRGGTDTSVGVCIVENAESVFRRGKLNNSIKHRHCERADRPNKTGVCDNFKLREGHNRTNSSNSNNQHGFGDCFIH